MTDVNVGTSAYVATLTGTWKLTVKNANHVTGDESLQAVVPFTSPDSHGCTYSPTSWTLGFLAALGTDTLAGGTPGKVQGKQLVVSLSNTGAGGWSGSPDQYTYTCGSDSGQWPILVQYEFGSSTGAPVETTVKLPLAFFKKKGDTHKLQVSTVENATFTQTYTLTKRPSS